MSPNEETTENQIMYTYDDPQSAPAPQLGRTKPLQHLPASISRSFRRKPPAPAPLPVSPRIKAALKPRKKR